MTKQELASKIWAMADKMRSKVKANEYKDYILGFIFYKYLSDIECDFLRSQGFTDEEFSLIDEDVIDILKLNIGYAIEYQDLFSTWKTKGINLDVKTVSDSLNRFNKNINPSQKSVFYNIFNTLQNGIDKLGDSSGSRSKAIRDIVDMIDAIPTTNTNYDVLGYIYEYMIYRFATTSKEDGAFYTPHEVSQLISMIVAYYCRNKTELKIYDPTSGSGALLLNIGKEAGKTMDKNKIHYFAQEKITETYHITRMNLIMNGIPSQNITVRNGDTLDNDWPYFDENTAYNALRVDAVVSNPPYSQFWEPESHTMDERFKKYGMAPSSKADYAFLLHCLYHLNNDGIMAIVLPHGTLFREGTEYQIRKNLCIEHNIETIIGLPSNMFYATSIPTYVMILRKNRQSDDILFIDASQSYEKTKKQNTLRDCDVKKIFDAVVARKDIDNFAKLVTFDEIKTNDFNLNIPRYVNASKDAETYDFAGLMMGTVSNTELEKYNDIWAEFKTLRSQLFIDLGNGYSKFADVDIKDTIYQNGEILVFSEEFKEKVQMFKKHLIKILINNYSNNVDKKKDTIVDELFNMLSSVSIIDRYDVYQLLMNNWITIENDILTMENDKSVCRNTEPNMVVKKVKKVDTEVQYGYKGTILSFDLVGSTYFTDEYTKLKNLIAEKEFLESEVQDIFDSLEEDMKVILGNKDADAFKEASIKKFIKNDADKTLKEDLQKVLAHNNRIKVLKKEIKAIDGEILNSIKIKIENLTNNEIDDMLVIKWINPICKDVQMAVTQFLDIFIRKVEDLKKKYIKPLNKINEEIEKKDKELSELLNQLVGSDIDMQAINLFKSAL